MVNLTGVEHDIVETARYYRSNPPYQWKSKTGKFDSWYRIAYEHMIERTWPDMKSDGECLVGCWPALFAWGQRSVHKRSAFEDRHLLHKMGTYATGYTCVTMSNLYIVCIRQLTERYPLYPRGARGFVLGVLQHTLGEVDDRKPLEEDRVYRNSLQSILGAEIVQDQERQNEDVVAIRSANNQLLIYDHFAGDVTRILAAIRMAQSGRLAQALGLQLELPVRTVAPATDDDPVRTLEQLKQLLNKGLISNEDYEAKKIEVLSRM